MAAPGGFIKPRSTAAWPRSTIPRASVLRARLSIGRLETWNYPKRQIFGPVLVMDLRRKNVLSLGDMPLFIGARASEKCRRYYFFTGTSEYIHRRDLDVPKRRIPRSLHIAAPSNGRKAPASDAIQTASGWRMSSPRQQRPCGRRKRVVVAGRKSEQAKAGLSG